MLLIIRGVMAMPLDVNDGEKYQTGYIAPDTEYPPQPVKVAELENVVAVRLSGKQAYSLKRVCKALGYDIVYDNEIITLNKGEETHIINTKNNPEIQIIDGVCYVADSLFNTLFGLSFRYFEDIGILGIFKATSKDSGIKTCD
jgi:hypothetical protein